MKYRLSNKAIRDFYELQSYIADDDDRAAEQVSMKLVAAVQLIARNPAIGRPTSQRVTRQWPVPGLPYVIPYRVKGGTVEILRFFHTSRRRPKRWL